MKLKIVLVAELNIIIKFKKLYYKNKTKYVFSNKNVVFNNSKVSM